MPRFDWYKEPWWVKLLALALLTAPMTIYELVQLVRALH